MPAERMNEEVDGSHLKDDSSHGGYCALAAESFWSALSGLNLSMLHLPYKDSVSATV